MASFTTPLLFPKDGPAQSADIAGFRFGEKGTHSSRTMMLDELTMLFQATPATATRKDYMAAIVEMNCLAKPTAVSRRLTNQRLGELYALDFALPIFRVFRRLWDIEPLGRRLLAMECAMARDPLLAATAEPILSLPPGAEFQREPTNAALREVVGDRMNDSVLGKVVRNAASSWAQAGHLEGRTFKKRRRVEPTPCTVAFALYLGHLVGFRGGDLFSSGWMAVLDCPPSKGQELALEAKRIGLLDMRVAGNVIEINLERLDPMPGRK